MVFLCWGGGPNVFLCFRRFSMVKSIFLWFFHGFPMVYHGFPMVFPMVWGPHLAFFSQQNWTNGLIFQLEIWGHEVGLHLLAGEIGCHRDGMGYMNYLYITNYAMLIYNIYIYTYVWYGKYMIYHIYILLIYNLLIYDAYVYIYILILYYAYIYIYIMHVYIYI
jgi:hypothetical protein